MMTKKKLMLTLFIGINLLTTILCFYAIKSFNANRNGFICTSNTSLEQNDFKLNAHFIYLFSKGKGSLRVNGTIFHLNKKYTLSRQIHYHYTQKDSEFTLENDQVIVFSNDNIMSHSSDKHIPSFFSKEHQKLSMRIKKDISGNRVIFMGMIPVFYCSK